MTWSRLDLGVGLIAVEGIDLLWPAIQELVEVLEVEPQTLWDHTDGGGMRIGRAALDWLRTCRRPLLSHGVGYPVGGTVAPASDGVRASARSARELDAVHWSEHLSFNRAGTRAGDQEGDQAKHAGYLLPPVPLEETVQAAVVHIRRFQEEFERPFLVETPTSYLRAVDGDLTDGRFVAEIAERADCGILLDLHNVWANELNGRQTVADFVAELPLERVWEVHLAGGDYLDELYLDAHIGPVPAPLLELARQVVPTLPRMRALMFEAIPDSVAELGADGLIRVLHDLHELARLPQQPAPSSRPVYPRSTPPPPGTAARREEQLLAYTTRSVDSFPTPDPGADALRHLTDHARLSLLVDGHAGELRQLLLEHGRDGTDRLLREFLARTPASAWPAQQSAAFSAWFAGV